mmetsp:Transcript_14229/g.40269  ORF Transcript_14229/g.40269 Transcript_14229/m.40269 type:complete len:386 (-) Transcript_14229:195-1352(-)
MYDISWTNHSDWAKLFRSGLTGERVTQVMAGATGDAFECFVPRTKEESLGGDAADAGDNVDPAAREQAALRSKQLAEMEKQLLNLKGMCQLKRMGYWSYKICPFQSVEQIHYEGNVNQMSFSLGTYATLGRLAARAKPSSKRSGSDDSQPNGAERAPSDAEDMEWVQTFVNGTNGRETRVVYLCEATTARMTVASIEEIELHKYEIHVQTPFACNATAEWQAKQLLLPLIGQCVRRTEDWWTYELCFERHIRQFHKEKDGRLTEFSLGEFGTLDNARIEKSGELLSRDPTTLRPVMQQSYSGGTLCDLKEVHRASTVFYLCSAQAQHDSLQATPIGIVSITESPSCNYIVKVHVPQLCDHPYFKEGGAAQVRSTITTIHCVPSGA